MYELFSKYYDKTYKSLFYKKYATFIRAVVKFNSINEVRLLDVGCGTGQLIKQLKSSHYHLEGVDASTEMLKIAKRRNQDIRFYNQNFIQLNTGKKYNVIVSTFDTVNYLTNKRDLIKAFKNVSKHLMEGGLFIFDINTIYKKIPKTFITNGMIFHNKIQNKYWFSMIEINKTGNNLVEFHKERLYSFSEIDCALKESGLKVDTLYSDFKNQIKSTKEISRLFFIAKKSICK